MGLHIKSSHLTEDPTIQNQLYVYGARRFKIHVKCIVTLSGKH